MWGSTSTRDVLWTLLWGVYRWVNLYQILFVGVFCQFSASFPWKITRKIWGATETRTVGSVKMASVINVTGTIPSHRQMRWEHLTMGICGSLKTQKNSGAQKQQLMPPAESQLLVLTNPSCQTSIPLLNPRLLVKPITCAWGETG